MSLNLKEEVASRLAKSGTDVKDRVVEHLYVEELNRRTNAALVIVEKIDALDKDIKKQAKPDLENYDEDGTVISASYSKERVDALRKLRQEREKLTNALTDAINKNDFQKVLDLGKK